MYKLKQGATLHSICVHNGIYNSQVKHNYPLVKLTSKINTSTDTSILSSKKIVPYSDKLELINYPIKTNESLSFIFIIEMQNASNYIGSFDIILNYT